MSALRQPTSPSDMPPVAALPSTQREVLDAIRESYTFVDSRNETEALGIVAKRPDIAAVLLEALPHVREIFGVESQVLLIATCHHDGHAPSLSARIEAQGSLSEQLAKQDDLYHIWWLNAGDKVLGELTFGV